MMRFFGNPERERERPGEAPPPAGSGPQDMAHVLASLLEAVVGAKRAMDEASAHLASIYWENPILRSLPLPSFSIPEVTVRLKFAVADVRPAPGARASVPPQMRVIVDLPSLEKLPPHLVAEVELRLTPQALRAYQGEKEGEVQFGRG